MSFAGDDHRWACNSSSDRVLSGFGFQVGFVSPKMTEYFYICMLDVEPLHALLLLLDIEIAYFYLFLYCLGLEV